MRTAHMSNRMRQRKIGDAEVSLILEFGDWNSRADRLVLTAKICAKLEKSLREEIKSLENITRQ